MFKKSFLIIILSCLSLSSAFAQKPDRQQWLSDMRELKHDYLVKELNLSRDQKERFFDIYDKMDDQIAKINSETRALERKVRETPDSQQVSDLEYDMAIQAMVELKGKECDIEKEYYEQLRSVLTRKQLFELKKVERNFTMKMMKQHQKIKNSKPNDK